jgi:hypothetical protein
VIVDAASPAKANMQWINCDPLRADAVEKVHGMPDGHGLASVRNFGLAERRFGSKRELPSGGLMSASTSCGHAAA